MTPQDQEFLLEDGHQYGDCARATIASLLDLPIRFVPHFLKESDGTAYGFHTLIEEFLAGHGYDILWQRSLVYHLSEDVDVYHYISGPSPRKPGVHHAVVGLNGKVFHDPHPSRLGLAGEPKDWSHSFLAVRLK